MKFMKKTLSVLLSVVFIFSAVSAGVVAFAADSSLDSAYENLAYSFFNTTTVITGGVGKRVISTDENGYKKASIVHDLTQYSVENTQGSYMYSDSFGNPVRSFAYDHKVIARDNRNYDIRNAALLFYGIADKLISTTYGVGNYTVPMLIDAVTKELKKVKAPDGTPLLFDGKSYFVDGLGNLVSVSDYDSYFLDSNGEPVFYNVYDEATGTWSYDPNVTEERESLIDRLTSGDGEGGQNLAGLFAGGNYDEVTLYDYLNVDTIIGYFCGNCTSINSGNWFHNYEFYCYTDLETVLMTEDLTSAPFTVRYLVADWTLDRQFDESGTKPQYFNKGYTLDKDRAETNTDRKQLSDLSNAMHQYFDRYYGAKTGDPLGRSVVEVATNSELYGYYEDIMADYEQFSKLSSKVKLKCFGTDAFSYMNLVTQLTPIELNEKYLPSRTVGDYVDKTTGEPVKYQVTVERVTGVVDVIDALLTNKKLAASLKSFIDPNDPEGLTGGQDYDTVQEMVQKLLQHLVYQDSIINMLFGLLFPMLTDLIDDNVNQALIDDLVGGITGSSAINSAIEGLLGSVLGEKDGWTALVYELLATANIGVTPGGVARCMNMNGYQNVFPQVYQQLVAAKGGKNSYGGFEGVIGVEGDAWSGLGRWKDVNFDTMYWGVNGDSEKFKSALSCVLLGAMPLLECAFGAQRFAIPDVVLGLDAVIQGANGYDAILLPLFETLGISADDGLLSTTEFVRRAKAANDSYTPETVTAFIDGIIGPLLNWLENDVLENPITVVMTLLPNLSYYLTSGTLINTINKFSLQISINIYLLWGLIDTDIDVYKLNLEELIGDKITFLTSVDNILNEFVTLGGSTGNPIIGYTYEGVTATHSTVSSNMVYRTQDEATRAAKTAGAVSGIVTTGVTEAYKNASGNLARYEDGEYNQKVTGLKSDGSVDTSVAVLNSVGYANSAGNVLMASDLITSELVNQYKTKVYVYYEYYTYTDKDGKTVTSESDPGTGYTAVRTRTTHKPADSVKYKTVFDAEMEKQDVTLPAIMDYKLQATGTETLVDSLRESTLTNSKETWAVNKRKCIVMQKDGKNTSGLVLLFLFRYIFAGVNYRAYEPNSGFKTDLTVIDSFGLGDTLYDDLFNGLKLIDIINNITLNPDAAICALWELLSKNEFGSVLAVAEHDDGSKYAVSGPKYTYPLEPVDYKVDELVGAATEHNDWQFGPGVLYTEYWTRDNAQYITSNLDNVVEDVLAMLKLEDFASLSGFIEDLLTENVFNNKVLTNIAYRLYDFISELNLSGLFVNALDVDYSKTIVANSIEYELGEDCEAAKNIRADIARKANAFATEKPEGYSDKNTYAEYSYDRNTFYAKGIDESTGEDVWIPVDWGFDNPAINSVYSNREIFLRGLVAAASPYAFLVRFLFVDEPLSVFDLVTIPSYAGFYYAWIPLMEALSANAGLITYNEYFTKTYCQTGTDAKMVAARQNCDCLYYFCKPIFQFCEDLINNPVDVLFSLIPNLMFFITIGGLNDLVNNLVHVVYVLADILAPIYDLYPLANQFLSNLDVGGIKLNLSLPLDFDANQLINSLLESLLGESLSFDIENKNIIVGTHQEERERKKLDDEGNPIYAEDGETVLTEKYMETVEDYQMGKLSITLPYIDFSTLCVGTITPKTSKNGEPMIYLYSAGGADLLTLVLRLVMDTLFFESNAMNIATFLETFCALDGEDSSLLEEIFLYLNNAALENDIPDKILGILYTVLSVLIPIADGLGGRFKQVDFSITDLFDAFSDMPTLLDYAKQLMNAGSGTSSDTTKTLSIFGRLIKLLSDLFARIGAFFRNLFSGVKTKG